MELKAREQRRDSEVIHVFNPSGPPGTKLSCWLLELAICYILHTLVQGRDFCCTPLCEAWAFRLSSNMTKLRRLESFHALSG